MSERINGVPVIYAEASQQCDDCGKMKELRPYGPNGTVICWECSEKDPVGRDKRMALILFGVVI